jgi:hypothetical protein
MGSIGFYAIIPLPLSIFAVPLLMVVAWVVVNGADCHVLMPQPCERPIFLALSCLSLLFPRCVAYYSESSGPGYTFLT